MSELLGAGVCLDVGVDEGCCAAFCLDVGRGVLSCFLIKERAFQILAVLLSVSVKCENMK